MVNNIILSHYFYISTLIIGISGMVILDWRFSLAFFKNAKASLTAITSIFVLLFIYDLIGINNDIFYTNQSYVSGIHLLSKNLPLEEFLFLFLLSYFTINTYNLIKIRLS